MREVYRSKAKSRLRREKHSEVIYIRLTSVSSTDSDNAASYHLPVRSEITKWADSDWAKVDSEHSSETQVFSLHYFY